MMELIAALFGSGKRRTAADIKEELEEAQRKLAKAQAGAQEAHDSPAKSGRENPTEEAVKAWSTAKLRAEYEVALFTAKVASLKEELTRVETAEREAAQEAACKKYLAENDDLAAAVMREASEFIAAHSRACESAGRVALLCREIGKRSEYDPKFPYRTFEILKSRLFGEQLRFPAEYLAEQLRARGWRGVPFSLSSLFEFRVICAPLQPPAGGDAMEQQIKLAPMNGGVKEVYAKPV